MILYENHLICILMKINEHLENEAKLLHNLVTQGVIRPTLNS